MAVQATGDRAHPPSRPAADVRNAVELRNADVTFRVDRRAVQALSGVSLQVPEGGFMTLLGPSGCGKSTTLRLIADLVAPSAGSVTVLGEAPSVARRERRIGFVFQDATLLPWRRVIDNVLLPLEVGAPAVRQRRGMSAEEALKRVGLEAFHRAYPSQLSGGMRQRAAIARALVTRPDILLLDEPFAALDEFTRERMNELLLEIWRDGGVTVVFVTHSISEAVFLGQQVAVFTGRPGTVREVIPVTLPEPRELPVRDTPGFVAYVARIRGLQRAGIGEDL